MKKIEVTCIECPMGCTMTVTEDNGVFTVEGNNCPRGEAYAKAEVTCPRRVLTTTIKLKNGKILAVKYNLEGVNVLKSKLSLLLSNIK